MGLRAVEMHFWEDWRDRGFLLNAEDLEIIDGFKLERTLGSEKFYQYLLTVDLVIFVGDAAIMCERFQNHQKISSFQQFFQSKIKKVWWTMDSHHMWQLEQKFQPYFDKIYIGHSQFMDKFLPEKVGWMPGYFESCTISALLGKVGKKNKKIADVGMVYEAYLNIGNRNFTMAAIAKVLKEQNRTCYFGKIERGADYLALLQSFNVGLSVSLFGNNVDQRLFEVIGLGGVLLTEQTPDHAKIHLQSANIHYFQRDLSDFLPKLEESLNDKVLDLNGIYEVLNRHMFIHRVIAIINDCQATSYKVESIPKWFLRKQIVINQQQQQSLESLQNANHEIYTENFLKTRAIFTCIKYGNLIEAEKLLLAVDTAATDKVGAADMINVFEYAIKLLYQILENRQDGMEHWFLLALFINKEMQLVDRFLFDKTMLACGNADKIKAVQQQAGFIKMAFALNLDEQ